MKNIFFYLIFTLLIIGCGGSNAGGNGEGSDSIVGSEESGEMTLNKLYIMHPGNKVKKLSDDALIQVIHIEENPDSSIKLLTGKASITR